MLSWSVSITLASFLIVDFKYCRAGDGSLDREPMRALIRTNSEPVWALAFSPDGGTLAVGSSAPALPPGADPWDQRLPEGIIELFDLPSGKLIQVLRQSAWREGSDSANRVVSLVFSPDGQKLLGSDAVGYMLWDLETGKSRYQWHGMLSNDDSRPDWSKDGRQLALPWMEISGRSPGIAVVDVATGKELRFFPVRQSGYVRSARFSPDGRVLATAGADCEVRAFDLASGQELLTDETRGTLFAAAFSPDGRQLVAGSSWSGVLLLYEVTLDDSKTSIRRQGTSAATAEEICSVEFTPDGKRALSVSHAGIRVWDAVTWTDSERILNCKARLSTKGDSIALVRNDEPTRVEIWRLEELPAEPSPVLR